MSEIFSSSLNLVLFSRNVEDCKANLCTYKISELDILFQLKKNQMHVNLDCFIVFESETERLSLRLLFLLRF